MMFVKRFCFIFPRLWSVETVKYKRHFNLNDWVEMKWSCHQQQWVISVSRFDHFFIRDNTRLALIDQYLTPAVTVWHNVWPVTNNCWSNYHHKVSTQPVTNYWCFSPLIVTSTLRRTFEKFNFKEHLIKFILLSPWVYRGRRH